MNPQSFTGSAGATTWPPTHSNSTNGNELDFGLFLQSQANVEAYSNEVIGGGTGLWSTNPPSALSPQALANLAASSHSSPLKSSNGPMRREACTASVSPQLASPNAASASTTAGGKDGESGDQEPPAPPVKNACTFCRSRKSRCNGKQPCAKCVARGREDDCVFTVCRRGGKPKPRADTASSTTAPFERHLEQLFGLSDLPLAVRVPGMVPQLRQFQTAPGPGGSDWDFDGTTDVAVDSAANVLAPAQNTNAWNLSAQQLGSSIPAPVAASAESLIDEYYRYLYRFIPVFLAPAYAHLGAGLSVTQSPFLLAMQCILPLLRDEERKPNTPMGQTLNFGSSDKHARVRDVTTYFERAASEAIDAALERIEAPDVDARTALAMTLEVIQALCVISIYEYGSGRAIKSRLKTDQALGLAMSKGLHCLAPPSSQSQGAPSSFQPADQGQGNGAQLLGAQHVYAGVPAEELYEMKKRAWWTVWNLVMWSAYNTARTPTIRADDPRVRSELPSCDDEGAWADNVQTMQALLLVQDRVLALSNLDNNDDMDAAWTPSGFTASPAGSFSPFGGSHTPGSVVSNASRRRTAPVIPGSFSSLSPVASRKEILHSMEELDVALQERIAAIESPPAKPHATSDLPSNHPDCIEAGLAAYLRGSSAIVLYASSLTLHIGQAFQGATLFERKLCFLSSVTETAGDMATCQVPMPETISLAFGIVDAPGSASWLAQVPHQAPIPIAPAPERSLYERGPFLPRLSLDRCVHASKCMLETSRPANTDPLPNPFGACSYVLISFVCLMQALAISGGVQEEDETFLKGSVTSATASKNYSRELLMSAKHGAAYKMQRAGGAAQAQQADTRSARLQRLERIWQRVKEAHDRLRYISESWAIAIPMQEEVSNCLAASKALLTTPENETFSSPQIKHEPLRHHHHHQHQQQNNYSYASTQ